MRCACVDETEVVRYYLKSELGKVVQVWKQTKEFVKRFDNAIDELDLHESIRLMKALTGKEYRDNSLHEHLGRSEYRWKKENVPCDLLRLPEVNASVNHFLEKHNFNLHMFVQYLKNEGRTEPDLVKEFPDDGRKIWHAFMIATACPPTVQILDGAHRAVVLASRCHSKIGCYVGYKLDTLIQVRRAR